MKSTAASEAKQKKGFTPLRAALTGLAAFCALILLFTLLTPLPASYMIRLAFREGPAVPPDGYKEMQKQVLAAKDLTYPSAYKDNTADIFTPKEGGLFPVVLWVHGGGFAGGDKRDIEIYATALAAEGFGVVCINYRRAPEAKYPTPLLQTGEAIVWLGAVAGEYSLDTNRLVLAGDSAGAHIAAQFAAIQSNPAYAEETGITPTVSMDKLKALLLFCGPYDASEISNISSPFLGFMLGKAAQAYFGMGNWEKRLAGQADIGRHVTETFPPAFISDSNTNSFESHGKALAQILKDKQVPVEEYFIPMETEVTSHEYQFVMNTPAGRKSFQKTVSFLQEHTK